MSYYHPEPRLSINQAVAEYIQETYGVKVSQQYIADVRRICKREASEGPSDKPLTGIKMEYIKEALGHLGIQE